MAKITLTCPQDGLVASEVGIWAKEKHDYLRRYIQISSKARVKYIPDKNSPEKYTAGATYIDLFCGSGRSKIKDSNEWIDGSAIVAWKTSQQSGAPFSQIYIADSDEQNLLACKTRLEALGAVVVARHGTALDALSEYCDALSPHGLHFSFIDPFNLKSLDFTILESLSNLKRIDAYSYPKEPLIITAKRPLETIPKKPRITAAKKPLPILNQAVAFVFIWITQRLKFQSA